MTNTLWPQIIIAASTLVAALVGYLLAGFNEARRDKRAEAREKLARAEERHSAALRDRHQFQLDTLLSLQDAVQLKARLTGRTMHFDHMQAREEKYTQLPPPHDDEILANGFDVIRLRTRVLDPELREAIERFEGASAKAILPPTHFVGVTGPELELSAASRSEAFFEEYREVMGRLGESLRKELAWVPDEAETA